MPARGYVKYSPDELEQRIADYFEDCANTQVEAIMGKTKHTVSRPPTWVGMALFLEVDRKTLARWKAGEYGAATTDTDTGEIVADKNAQQRVCHILTRAEDRIIDDAYEGAALGRYNDRITQMRLARMGETVPQEVKTETSMVVKWEGVDPLEAAKYGR